MTAPPSRPRAAEICKALENEILTDEGFASARLDEQEIARRFGVSRTPVREALRHLASTGLVDLIPNRGAFVRRLSTDDLVQMFEVMAGIEALAGRLAARRADRDALARLADMLAACEAAARAGDSDRYYAENGRFHSAIYDASGNPFLAAEAGRLHQRLRAYRRLQLRVGSRMDQSLAEHRRIVAALAAGDAERAEAELREHVAIQGERFTDLVASLTRRGAAE